MLLTLLAFAIALGLLITFHELGHYAVARLCRVRVLRFSLGFGRVLAQRTDRHGTEWALSVIPLGGYVKMMDVAPQDAPAHEAAQAFDHKPLWQRSAIVAAGPAANFLLAVVLYAGINLAGVQEPLPILAPPAAGTAAAQAGLKGGEHIVAVDGTPVMSWNQVRWHVLDASTAGGEVTLQAQFPAAPLADYRLQFPAHDLAPDGPDALAAAGLSLAMPPPTVREVIPGSAGEAAGLRPGDQILSIGDTPTPDARRLIDAVSAQAGVTLPLAIMRDATQLRLSVTPQAQGGPGESQVGRIGVMLGGDVPMALVRYGTVEGTWRAVQRTASTAWFSLRMLGRMVVGDVSLRNLSGPVTIADYAGQTARAGLTSYIGFLALISISIGVLNLLPVPMLDGGHLALYVVEAIRGRPLPDAWLEYSHRIGLALLVGLMGLAFFNDVLRLFS